MKNKYVSLFLLLVLYFCFCSCERDKNIDILINGESLNYEVRATYIADTDNIFLLITDRFIDGAEDISISIKNLKSEIGNLEFVADPFSDDSLSIRARRVFPEFGNQERSSLLTLDCRYDNYFELVSFDKNVGQCKFKTHLALPERERDFEGYDPERYEFEIEGDFEFKIF